MTRIPQYGSVNLKAVTSVFAPKEAPAKFIKGKNNIKQELILCGKDFGPETEIELLAMAEKGDKNAIRRLRILLNKIDQGIKQTLRKD